MENRKNIVESTTMDEFLSLNKEDDVLREFLDGEIYLLSSPSINHFYVTDYLHSEFKDYLKKIDSKCRSYHAPVDLKLGNNNVVIPDIMIVCSKSTNENYFDLVPPLIVEILSPGNVTHDTVYKRRLYEKNGVKEYWMIHLIDRYVEICFLEPGGYKSEVYYKNEIIKSKVFEGLNINVLNIFNNIENN